MRPVSQPPSSQKIGLSTGSSAQELDSHRNFVKLFKESPLPDDELMYNLGLYIRRQSLSRILFMQEIYRKILEVPGVVMEFGVRWGQNMALFQSFRGLYEPFNHHRKIVGFDTFRGFPSVDPRDGKAEGMAPGTYDVPPNYQAYLEKILAYHEVQSPIAHKKKYELVVGDACQTLPLYLEENPETIVALVYFDFDLYEPTKACLQAIRPHLTKGSIVGFDELNQRSFPGETAAFQEVFGSHNVRLRRIPSTPDPCYFVVE
jgi:hypothetical protein